MFSQWGGLEKNIILAKKSHWCTQNTEETLSRRRWYRIAYLHTSLWSCKDFCLKKMSTIFFKNGPTPDTILFIFVLFKHTVYRKNGFWRILTRIVRVEGEHADHYQGLRCLLFLDLAFMQQPREYLNARSPSWSNWVKIRQISEF